MDDGAGAHNGVDVVRHLLGDLRGAFKLEGAGNQLTFTQAAKPKTDAEVVDGAMKVTITGVRSCFHHR